MPSGGLVDSGWPMDALTKSQPGDSSEEVPTADVELNFKPVETKYAGQEDKGSGGVSMEWDVNKG